MSLKAEALVTVLMHKVSSLKDRHNISDEELCMAALAILTGHLAVIEPPSKRLGFAKECIAYIRDLESAVEVIGPH